MNTFQSIHRSLDVQLSNKKVVSFRDYTLMTNDEEAATDLRKMIKHNEENGRAVNFWEAPDGKSEEEVPQRPRRGRPPKAVQGARSADIAKEMEE